MSFSSTYSSNERPIVIPFSPSPGPRSRVAPCSLNPLFPVERPIRKTIEKFFKICEKLLKGHQCGFFQRRTGLGTALQNERHLSLRDPQFIEVILDAADLTHPTSSVKITHVFTPVSGHKPSSVACSMPAAWKTLQLESRQCTFMKSQFEITRFTETHELRYHPSPYSSDQMVLESRRCSTGCSIFPCSLAAVSAKRLGSIPILSMRLDTVALLRFLESASTS